MVKFLPSITSSSTIKTWLFPFNKWLVRHANDWDTSGIPQCFFACYQSSTVLLCSYYHGNDFKVTKIPGNSNCSRSCMHRAWTNGGLSPIAFQCVNDIELVISLCLWYEYEIDNVRMSWEIKWINICLHLYNAVSTGHISVSVSFIDLTVEVWRSISFDT